MRVENYYRVLSHALTGAITYGVGIEKYIKKIDGTVTTRTHITGYSECVSLRSMRGCITTILTSLKTNVTSINQYYGVAFGNGTSKPTINDYSLSGDIVTGITVSTALSGGYDDEGSYLECLYTILNNNAEAITIGEIGYFDLLSVRHSSSSSSGVEYSHILLDREALETPITIEPSSVGQVTYKYRVDIPTT